jgi:hypothetical protein
MNPQLTLQQPRTPFLAATLWKATGGLILVLLSVQAPRASAQTVTGGTLTIVTNDAATFTLSGVGDLTGVGNSTDTFTVKGYTYVPGGNELLLCRPCSNPLYVFFGASGLDFNPWGSGAVTISGTPTTYPTIAFDQLAGPTGLFINGPSIPLTWTGPWPHTFTSSVTYDLALCGITDFTGPPHCDVTFPDKSGTAVLDLTIDIDPIFGYFYGTAAKVFF